MDKNSFQLQLALLRQDVVPQVGAGLLGAGRHEALQGDGQRRGVDVEGGVVGGRDALQGHKGTGHEHHVVRSEHQIAWDDLRW